MPTDPPYTILADYLTPGHPEENQTDSSVGNTYIYRGPSATIATNKPQVGQTWADGRAVLMVRAHEVNGISATSELTVVTSTSVTYSETIGTAAVEQTHYELIWRPVMKPLEVHPYFMSMDATAHKCIIGWRAELDPALRAAYKFKPLDSNGTPGAEVDIAAVSAVALKFVKLQKKGVEEYVDYLPVWRKRGIYLGANPPVAGAIGLYDDSPPSLPTAVSTYHFVKSADNVERIGSRSRWRRDEEWEGGKQVYADRDNIFLTGNPESPGE